MIVFKDQLGRDVIIHNIPQRIISLVPSQTELLFELGVGERVIGITKFCIHPEEWFRSKQRVGGTKNFKVDLIRSLSPDLIIANKEENELSLLAPLMNEFPVWVSDISTIKDACEMIAVVGAMVDSKEQSQQLISSINDAFDALKNFIADSPLQTAAYFIWQEPWMSIGADTFIHDMLQRCGLDSVFKEQLRYPVCTLEELQQLHPDLILLSSEPFPFKEIHQQKLQQQFPSSKVVLVDGEYFSWYGSRLKSSPAYFKWLLEQL